MSRPKPSRFGAWDTLHVRVKNAIHENKGKRDGAVAEARALVAAGGDVDAADNVRGARRRVLRWTAMSICRPVHPVRSSTSENLCIIARLIEAGLAYRL